MTYDNGRDMERVVAIEYHPSGPRNALVPHSVFTTDHASPSKYCDSYDFDWCRRDKTIYYHLSGSGSFYMHPIGSGFRKPPRAAVWWDSSIIVGPTNGGNSSKRTIGANTLRRWGYDVLPEPAVLPGGIINPFDDAVMDDTEYCSRCKDKLPTERLCSHVWYCEKCGCYSSPGERCKHRRPE